MLTPLAQRSLARIAGLQRDRDKVKRYSPALTSVRIVDGIFRSAVSGHEVEV